MKQSRKTAMIIGYVTVAMQTVSSIVLTKLYVKYLGMETYGIYQMIYAVTQYILLFDFGITATVMRFRITALASGEKKQDENLLAHCVMIITALSTIVVIVGLVLSANIGNIYSSLTPSEVVLSQKMMFFMIAQIVMTLAMHFFLGIAMSEERYTTVKAVSLFEVAAKFVFVAILMLSVGNVMSIVYVDFAVALICLIYTAVYSSAKIDFHIKFHFFDSKLIKTIFYLMLALMLQSFATFINNAAGKTIIGIMMDKSSVAIYAFAITISSFFSAIPNSMNSVYVPKATQMILRKASNEELTDLVIGPGRIQFMFCGAVVSGFALFGRYFIHLWAGQEADLAYFCAVLILTPLLFPLVQNVCLSILTAMNKRLFRSLVVAGTSVLNIIVTVILIPKVGIIGAAIGTAVSVIIGNIIITNIYYYKTIGLNVIRMYKQIFSRTFLCILVASGTSALSLFIDCGEMVHLIIGVAIYCVVYAGMLFFYGANDSEKELIMKILKLKSFIERR